MKRQLAITTIVTTFVIVLGFIGTIFGLPTINTPPIPPIQPCSEPCIGPAVVRVYTSNFGFPIGYMNTNDFYFFWFVINFLVTFALVYLTVYAVNRIRK